MDKPILIKGKVFLSGNSYGIRVKKALIEAQVLTDGEEVTVILSPNRKLSEKDKGHDQNSPVVSNILPQDMRREPYNIRNFLGNTYKELSIHKIAVMTT